MQTRLRYHLKIVETDDKSNYKQQQQLQSIAM